MKKTFLSKALIAIAASSIFFSTATANAASGTWRKTGNHILGFYQYCYTAYPYHCMWLVP
ncbi:hypothetical protein [Actinobacillus vicugnae]|uniref:hypothetical protein n=1 Tax=Actinobacillus vicugnae TaxID=2573093 RepID=UPI00123FF49D|nr:hypothetical protein [Actinobacillus vicugnae]